MGTRLSDIPPVAAFLLSTAAKPSPRCNYRCPPAHQRGYGIWNNDAVSDKKEQYSSRRSQDETVNADLKTAVIGMYVVIDCIFFNRLTTSCFSMNV